MAGRSQKSCPECLIVILVALMLVSLWNLGAGSPARAADTPSTDSKSIALIGGRVLTQDEQGVIEGGTVVVKDGKIVAVGKEVEIPPDARRIDTTGLTITPGLIDVRSTMWLTPRSASQFASDASLNALDGVDAFSDDWQEVVRQGVTAVYVQPGAAGSLGGVGSVLSVGPAKSTDDLLIQRDAGLQSSLGLSSSSRNSRDRYSQFDRVKKQFDGAKKYKEEWDKYEEYQKKKEAEAKKAAEAKKTADAKSDTEKNGSAKGKKEEQKKGESKKEDSKKKASKKKDDSKKKDAKKEEPKKDEPKKDDPKKQPEKTTSSGKQPDSDKKKDEKGKQEKPPKKPKRDVTKDLLARVLKREIPLRLEVHRADDAQNALKLAEEFKIRVVLEGLGNLGVAAQTVLDERVPLVLGPFLEQGPVASFRRDRPKDWFRHFLKHDARWALATFGHQARASRLLRIQAAAAVASGFDPDRVLAAITKNAAASAGVDDRLGTISIGKRADLVAFAGHPLDPAAPVRIVLSGGRVVYERPDASPVDHGSLSHDEVLLEGPLPKQFGLRTKRLLMADGKFRHKLMVIERGRVSRIDPFDADTGDLEVMDLGDAVVTPGLVSAHASLGTAGSIDERGEAQAFHIVATDAFDPESKTVRRLVAGGVLRVAYAPGSVNVLSGQVGCVRLGSQQSVDRCDIAAKLVLASSARNNNRFPASLLGQLQLVRQFLDDESQQTRLYLPAAVKRFMEREQRLAVQSLRERRRVVLIHAETDAEIRAACEIVEQYALSAALVNPRQLDPFISRLGQLGMGVVARPVSTSDYSWYADDLARASQAGVPIAFGGDDAHSLRMTAAMAVASGMSSEAALKGLTTDGARVCGMQPNVAGLASGSPADFVIWNGSPLNLCAKPLHIVVDGQIVK